MQGIAKACKTAASEAFARLTEGIGLVEEIQGQSSIQGGTHARVLGLKSQAGLKAFNLSGRKSLGNTERRVWLYAQMLNAFTSIRLSSKWPRHVYSEAANWHTWIHPSMGCQF